MGNSNSTLDLDWRLLLFLAFGEINFLERFLLLLQT